jgi:Cu(I)/Ag(I) efflux system membrane fusion protein
MCLSKTGTGEDRRQGQLRINAYPDKLFEGKVTYVYPTLTRHTHGAGAHGAGQPRRAAQARNVCAGGTASLGQSPVVTVPVSAVIDSGTRQIVLVQLKEGRFEPREVKLGARSDTYVEVIDGVKEGEQVVVAANFLIDAESNLKAAIRWLRGTAAPKSAASSASGATGPASASHQAQGTVEEVDAKTGTVSHAAHGPIASLKWPAMTMEFNVANETLLKTLKPGAKVAVEFVERQPGSG